MSRSARRYLQGVERARIEVIPMIDIMMFLLVFFMIVTLSMIEGAGITLQLPRSSTAQALQPVQLTIGVTRDGQMIVEGQPVSEADLGARLARQLAAGRVEVIIAGDEAAAYQVIVRVMDVVRAAGVESVALTTGRS